jgi:acyl dehydratase
MTFEASELGTWGEPETFEVTAERIAAYAEATNDPIEAHRSGTVAPPVFAVVPVFNTLIPAVLAVAPPEQVIRVVHSDQDFRFHRPILPGDTLLARARPIGWATKDSGSGLAVHMETRTTQGELVNEQWVTGFFRGVDAGESTGERAPSHVFDAAIREQAPIAKVAAHVDDDQTFRYSPASGDPMPIHLDDDIARMAGLPGIIVHGLCMMAMTSWAVLTEVAGGQTDRLKRLAVRFAKPVLPGQDVSTAIWDAGNGCYAYETTVGDTVVMRDGLAEVS